MRANNIFIGVLLWTTTSAMAQNADSIVVTYDNQHTTIQMPALGKKTTIKMADSVQVIEIDVSRRKLTDLPYSALYATKNSSTAKPLIKNKWFSEVEVGYARGFVSKNRFPLYTSSSSRTVYHINNDPWLGFSLGLTVFNRERIINRKLSYDIGLKFGLANYFRNQKPITELPYDTINQIQHIYIDYNTFRITRLQFLIPLGMRYSLVTGKSISKINFGASLGAALNIGTFKYHDDGILRSETYLSPLILQPYLGFEYRKFGLLSTLGIEMINGNLAEVRYSLGFSLTYRFF
jgi:hypothetical protein